MADQRSFVSEQAIELLRGLLVDGNRPPSTSSPPASVGARCSERLRLPRMLEEAGRTLLKIPVGRRPFDSTARKSST